MWPYINRLNRFVINILLFFTKKTSDGRLIPAAQKVESGRPDHILHEKSTLSTKGEKNGRTSHRQHAGSGRQGAGIQSRNHHRGNQLSRRLPGQMGSSVFAPGRLYAGLHFGNCHFCRHARRFSRTKHRRKFRTTSGSANTTDSRSTFRSSPTSRPKSPANTAWFIRA